MGGRWNPWVAAAGSLALLAPVLAVPVLTGAVPVRAAAAQEVPCPVAELDPPLEPPEWPDPPAHGPGERELGGPALASSGLVVPPEAPAVPAERLSATYWLVADLDTGAVLGGCGPHEHGVPASTLKLLLAAALLPVLDPDETVEIVAEDLRFEPGSSAVGLLLGGEYPIETLWLGLLLNSGNDAANVLARLGGGADGVEGGVAMMNAEAQRLGAYQTFAATPSGLDGPGQFTSAYDLALIARELFDRPVFRRYIATERVEIPPQPPEDPRGFEIQNQNRLLHNYPGALGGKTGFTNLARHSFVGAAQRDGRRLVVTLLGAEVRPVRSWQQAADLLDWGFSMPSTAAVGRLVTPEELAQVAASSTHPATVPASTVAPAPAGAAQAATGRVPVAVAVMVGGGVLAVLLLGLAVRARLRRVPGGG